MAEWSLTEREWLLPGRVGRRHAGGDAAARRESGLEGHRPRLEDGRQVVENTIGHVFIKDADVPELLQIELQAFQLHALAIGHVGDGERAEIGLPGLGTDRRELRAD